MSVSRRAFVRSLGINRNETLSDMLIGARGREAFAAELPASGIEAALQEQMRLSRNVVRISSNENPLGPGMAARDAMVAAIVDSNRYPMNAQTATKDLLAT